MHYCTTWKIKSSLVRNLYCYVAGQAWRLAWSARPACWTCRWTMVPSGSIWEETSTPSSLLWQNTHNQQQHLTSPWRWPWTWSRRRWGPTPSHPLVSKHFIFSSRWSSSGKVTQHSSAIAGLRTDDLLQEEDQCCGQFGGAVYSYTCMYTYPHITQLYNL